MQDLNNDIFKVYLAGKLLKHVLVWKVQLDPYVYEMYFHASFDNIKSVRIIKNYTLESTHEVEMDDGTIQSMDYREEINEEIYSESFAYEDNINKFEYLHEDSSETVIPTSKYLFEIETWDEYSIRKGFPENDTYQDNEYDHDYSLDEFGQLYNLPRKKYVPVEELYYPTTEPQYNDRLTEDDYHYMNRILYYIQNLFTTPLPVLEIWKLFGIPLKDISMINRDKYIARMIDVERHSDANGYIWNWSPHAWQHKDRWCSYSNKDLFFIANASNNTPIVLQTFYFNFNIIDSFCREQNNDSKVYYDVFNPSASMNLLEESDEPFYILPFVNGKLIDIVLYSDKSWSVTPCPSDTDDLIYIGDDGRYYLNNTDVDDFYFIFKCFRTLGELESEVQRASGKLLEFDDDWTSDEILINVRGCNSASWYVNLLEGDDSNSGMSKNNAFKTLDKALDMVEGERNIISLSDGKHIITGTHVIDVPTAIISCPGTSPVVYGDKNIFFSISQNASLYMQNVGLKYNCCKAFISNSNFINNNRTKTPFNIGVNVDNYTFVNGRIVNSTPVNCLIKTNLTLTLPEKIYYSEKFNLSGALTMDETGVGVSGESLKIIIDDELIDTIVTDSNGEYTLEDLSFDDTNPHTIKVVHEDSSRYNESEITRRITIEPYIVNLIVDTLDKAILVEELTSSNHKYSCIVQDYNLTNSNGESVTNGVLELYEDDILVETINPGEKFTYIPKTTGLKEYKIIYPPSSGNMRCIEVFNCLVEKNPLTLKVNRTIFLEEEEVIIKGKLTSLTGDIPQGPITLDGEIKESVELIDGTFTYNMGLSPLNTYQILIKYNNDLFSEINTIITLFVVAPDDIIYEDSYSYDTILLDPDKGYESLFDDKEYVILESEEPDEDNNLILADTDTDISDYVGEEDIILLDDESEELELIIMDNPDDEIIMDEFILETNDVNKFYKDNTRFHICLTDNEGNPLSGESLQLKINGVTYNRTTNSEGEVNFPLGLPAGEYNVFTIYNNYVRVNHVSIVPAYIFEAETWVVDYPTSVFTVRAINNSTREPLINETIVMNVNGQFLEVITDSEGYANFNIDLEVGEYLIYLYYDDGSMHIQTDTLVVRDKYVLKTQDLSMGYHDGSKFVVHLTDYDDNPLTNKNIIFNVNGTNFTRTTDNNGYARLNINLPAGKYTITTTYESVVKTNEITIFSESNLKLETSDLTKIYGANDQFIAHLTSFDNPLIDETITFNMNGHEYNRQTDDNGYARLNIRLPAGEYTIITSYGELINTNTIIVEES